MTLLEERIGKFEDALWAGVGAIHVASGTVAQSEWKLFPDSLVLANKSPGINDIGVGLFVAPDELDSFLAEQRLSRPDFNVHPLREKIECLPVTYLEPVASKNNAIELDIAHEENRYRAAPALATQATSISQDLTFQCRIKVIPGLFVLSPYYSLPCTPGSGINPEEFVGLVDAPFVVVKSTAGTLAA
ncbi:MAG: CHASE1-domain containing sensor protein [Candidatus Azotimanducaceae bacterium]|jgi:CHASE1-domain containing sensor protein